MDCMDFCSALRDLGVLSCVSSSSPKNCLSCSFSGCRAREGLCFVRDESGAGILLQEQRGRVGNLPYTCSPSCSLQRDPCCPFGRHWQGQLGPQAHVLRCKTPNLLALRIIGNLLKVVCVSQHFHRGLLLRLL